MRRYNAVIEASPNSVVFSGIQPTGQKHIGNYIGAILQYVKSQDKPETSIFSIVDLHAITVDYDPEELRSYVYDTLAILLASGLDPEKSILFRQSDVSEHTELCWLLGSVCAHGDLNRMHQFKDKSAQQQKLVSAGLFSYPVLQAADILLYKTTEVPVGEDQKQHIELAKDIAERFNSRYGEVLVVPRLAVPEVGAKTKDLQHPENKMSTSSGSDSGRIYILDDKETVDKKIRTSVTNCGHDILMSPDKEGVSNLISLIAVSEGMTTNKVEEQFIGLGYGDLKRTAADSVARMLEPVRERYPEIRGDEQYLEQVFEFGRSQAEAIAEGTLKEVKSVMGLGPKT